MVTAVPSLSDPTLTSPSLDIDNLESTLPPDHPDAKYLESNDNAASKSSNSASGETKKTKETKEPKQPELPPV
jgi:hypothetical protein